MPSLYRVPKEKISLWRAEDLTLQASNTPWRVALPSGGFKCSLEGFWGLVLAIVLTDKL